MSVVYKGGGTVIKPGRGITIKSSKILEKKDLGLGVTAYVPKNKNKPIPNLGLPTRSSGKGRAMSEAARTKFIKDKNPDYTVKKTKQGATYGVRQIVK